MRRLACLLLIASLLAAGERDRVEARVRAVADELAALGYEVDVDELGVEVRAFGSKMERDPSPLTDDEKRVVEAQKIVHAFGFGRTERIPRSPMGYFVPWRPTIVFTRALACTWTAGDGLTAHELVHVYQRQLRGPFDRAAWRRRSIELRNARRCLREGEADLVAQSLLFARLGRSFEDVPDEVLRLYRERTSGAGIPYRAGLAFVRTLGGREAIARTFADPPSTEEILHPEKRGRDFPTPIEWPEDLPEGELIHETTYGELGIGNWLGQRAGIGWDGDILRCYGPPGGNVVVWRSVWDRPEDAEQFARAARGKLSGAVVVRGRDALWVASRPSTLQEPWHRALWHSMKPRPVDADDAASTARIEAALPAADRIHDGRWIVGSLGARVPVPFGWRLQSDEAVSSLRLPAEGKSHARLFVDFLPYPGSLDDLERRYDAVGGELPWERSPVHRRVAIGGRDALLTTHTVLGWRILNAHVPWRGGLLMASLRVHVDTLEEQWTPARAALLDIEFAPR